MDSSLTTDEPGTADLRPSGIAPKTKARPPPPPFLLPLNVAFSICSIAHLIAAYNAPIQDCDETFNYWDPLHYLTHGSGLQTWEYSPEFSIRSWAYILLHAIPVKLISLLGKPRSFEFYFLRCLLATVCAATETRLYAAICRSLSPRIGVFYLTITSFTPGFFYASSAFLPSTFTMYTSTLALTAFIDRRGGPKTATGIMWFGIGALLGWPFAGALIIPFVLADWSIALATRELSTTSKSYLKGIIRCLIILALQIAIDASFYRKLTVVPLKIVLYNVFSGADRGPDIFGTEPWHFYIRNLLLNFNLWYILAMIPAPLILIQYLLQRQNQQRQQPNQASQPPVLPITNQPLSRLITLTSPFYLWFTIFTLQPHKEERFMFPSYPFLALNASIALHILLTWFNNSNPATLIGKIPARIKLALTLPIILASINLGLLRILGTVTAYRAPLQIYEPLLLLEETTGSIQHQGDANVNVCLGKDWYRYPSSFHLPPTMRPKFVKSAFTGLLPGPFHESSTTTFSSSQTSPLDLFLPGPGTYLIPHGMNDRNIEDPNKYVDIAECSFLVDSEFPSSAASASDRSELEPDYVRDEKEWEVVKCEAFLDNSATGVVARIIWTPVWRRVPGRVWGRHCLLRRRKGQST